MANSLHQGIVRAKQPSIADGPIEASVARDVSLNNLLHTADEAGQTAAAWSTRTGLYMEPQDALVANTWQLITTYTPVIALFDDRDSYYFRVRLGGASSAGHAVAFCCSLEGGPGEAVDYVYQTTTTLSGTHAWLAGNSQGPQGWQTLLRVPGSLVGPTAFSSPGAIGGSPDESNSQYRLTFNIWGTTANVASSPRLSGLYLCQYVGV